MGQNHKIKAHKMKSIKRQKTETVLCINMAKLFVRLQIVGSQKESHKQAHADKRNEKPHLTPLNNVFIL